MNTLLWTPTDHRIGDITLIYAGGLYHLFTEQSPLDWGGELGESFAGIRGVGHAVSKDMFEWEVLPTAITCGPPGSFDAYSIYHMDVYIHEGVWYMHYTGLDRGGPGEQQSIGVATSRDGIHWEKHPANPILRADPRWYEPAIPREATYQEKDFGRLWFRDPCIIRDPETGQFGMIVTARDMSKHPDVRACIAWATSDDLIRWQAHAPIFSPGRFHTVETPSLFERDGLHYIVYMSGSYWGPPLVTTDPYQNTGNFYAISRNGWTGPFEPPADEILAAATDCMRMGAARTVEGPNGERFYYGWLSMQAEGDDAPYKSNHRLVVPPPRRVRFADDGQMHLAWHEGIERYCNKISLPSAPTLDVPAFAVADGGAIGKHFAGRVAARYSGRYENFIFSTRIQFRRGERAGLVLRSDASGQEGLRVTVDRKLRRVELGTLSRDNFIDARAWKPVDEVCVKVVANGPSIEVYLDDRLYIHQVRHRETAGQIGWLIEKAEACFTEPDLRVFK